MDRNRIKGAAKQLKGSLKDVAGKVTGSTQLRLEGKADKLAGQAQSAFGKAKDKLKGR